MSRSSGALIVALTLACGVCGQEEQFNKDSFATFGGPSGPKVTACPWYHFNAAGLPVLPRGPSKIGDPCRSQTLQHYMKSFREGGTFTVVKGGTELFAHAGGTHNQGNDGDLDSAMVTVVPPQAAQPRSSLGQMASQRRLTLDTGSQTGTSSLSVSEVRLHIRTGDICMEAGGYGHKELVAATAAAAAPLSQEAVNFIQKDLCLCQADGVQSICYQRDSWGDDGESAWMPLPGSKGLGRALDIYIGLGEGTWAGWRSGSIAALKQYDPNSDGVIQLSEVLHEAPKHGVSQEWLDLMKKEDPCVVVNGQRDAYLWLQALTDIAEHPGHLAAEFKKAGVWPERPGDASLWGPGKKWLREKYQLGLLSDKDACRDQWNSASSQV